MAALLSRNEEVNATDLSESVPMNLRDFSSNPMFHYAACDVASSVSAPKAFLSSTDVIYHLASTVGVDQYINDPLGTIDNIVTGTRNVLEYCIEFNVRLISMSTSEIYGKNKEVPWSETSDRVLGDPSIDRWSYSTSKSLCEHLINAAHRKHKLQTTIIRPFNVYGPRQRPSFVIPATIQRILNGRPPLVYDDGEQTRCFTYVEDLIRGLLLSLDSESAIGQTFNLGSERESTINEVVEIALRACGSTLRPIHLDTAKEFGSHYEDIGRRVPDASKALRILGWKAETTLEEGITRTVEWMKLHPA